MKKYGKYEKKPEAVAQKQPQVKSALLQTYLTSLLCMVLCVAMFFGTSYAWFTSEITNTENEIYIGTLDVGLFKQETSDQGTVLADLSKAENKLFDKTVRWEPGYTALETLQVVNEGDLAFKYVLSFTEGKVTAPADQGQKLETVAQNFDIWVYDYYDNGNAAPVYTSYADINAEKGWVYVGTLADALAGKAVLSGNMNTVRQDDKENDPTTPNGTEDGVKTVDTYTIALHMREETSDISLMGHKIALTVKLVAYQKDQETDGFGSDEYDKVPGASSVGELKDVLANTTGDALLAADLEISKLSDTVTMADTVVLDGNGNKLVYKGERNDAGSSVGVLTVGGGTIRDLTVVGGDNGRALYITKLTADLHVSGCTFSGAYAFNINSAEKTDFTVNFTDTVFKTWTSYGNVMKHAYFTGCTFEGTLKPYGDTTLTGCEFTVAGLNVSELADGETITLADCTYNGVAIDNAVLKAEKDAEGNRIVTCSNALLEIKDGILTVVTP